MNPPSPTDRDALIEALFEGFRAAEAAMAEGLPATEPLARLRALMAEANRHPEFGLGYVSRQAKQLAEGCTPETLYLARVPLERVAAEADAPLPDPEEATGARMPLTLCAENLRSAFNVGGLFRTAHAFGLSGVWLAGYSPTPEHPQVARSALGTETRTDWKHWLEPDEALAAARERDVRIVALETGDDAVPLEAVDWTVPSVLLLGNERFGLSPGWVGAAEVQVGIPMAGAKRSLNVVVAAGIACHAARSAWEAGRAT